MKLRIGNTVLENNVILAPMAGVTDLPFRVLCREQGAGCVVTEMVSAKAVLYNNKNTRELLQIDPAERPAAVQLFGSEPDIRAEIAARLEEGPYEYIDVNMGCPVPKIVNNGEGSALMKNPERAKEVMTAMVKAVKKPMHGFEHYISVKVPPMAAVLFRVPKKRAPRAAGKRAAAKPAPGTKQREARGPAAGKAEQTP